MAERYEFFAASYGGPITHVGLDVGGTLTSRTAPISSDLAQRALTDEAVEVIKQLDEELDLTLMILSNTVGPSQDRNRALAAAGVAHRFIAEGVLQSHELNVSKPDPAFFERALKVARCDSPASYLVVGNNLRNDVLPAVSLGMRAVLVGPQPRRGIPSGATYINSIIELPYLMGMPRRRDA
ncbi:HAD family hydrolase [Actinomadura sp. NPDC047616]|uniref:HAD family hydrolase n=1 Tax=Actinomadura sp. NPDC047616 TaxID=3155914 RepID=UPI0033DD7217